MTLLRRIERVGRRHGAAAVGVRQTVGSRTVVPPPIRGLNSRDAYAAMHPEYALVLDNYFPDRGAARLRSGNRVHATGIGDGYPGTLVAHYSDTDKFFAISTDGVYDITPGAGAALALDRDLTSDRWSHATMGGQTVLVNGADEMIRVAADGTFVAAVGAGLTGPAGGALSANEKKELQTVTGFKNRLFLTRKNSPIVYYLGPRAVTGELFEFDLSYVEREGGNALHIGSMTIDSGRGVDDLFLVFMEHGIVLLYRGIDPSAADETGFFKVGSYRIGALVGDRPIISVGGDLFAHTVDGIVSMQQMLKRGRSGQKGVSLSDAITPALREQAATWGSARGWGAVLHPPTSWLLFSAPVAGGEQYVMNTQTGAWCRYRGWDARCWGRFDDKLYFGGPGGMVLQAGVGTEDHDADGNGVTIDGDIQTAYSYFRSPQEKRFTMTRSLVEADADINFQLGATSDFGRAADLTAPVSLAAEGGAIWDEAEWDVTAWTGGALFHNEWQAINRTGTALSVRMSSRSRGANIALFASDVVYENATGIA